MRRILISLLLLLPSAAFAQSVRYQGQVIGSRGFPLGNQNVAVCTQPANTGTTPCSPLATLATSTGTTSGGEMQIDVDNSATSIVIKLTFSGTSFTGKASASIERVI